MKRSITPGPEIERVDGICGGEPVIAGTRITVDHIWQCFFRLRWDVNRILKEYPELTKSQVMAAFKYGNRNPHILSRDRDE